MTVSGTPQIICTNSSATSRTLTPTAVTEANSISFRITAGTGTLSLTAGGYRDLDFTDGTNPTGYAGALGNTAISIYGNFKASTGMTRTAGATTYTFAATSGTKTINTAGVTFDNAFTFNGVGGTFQLVSAFTSGSSRTATLTNGTLDLNGFTLTTGLFTTNASNATTLAFGVGNITLSGTGTIFTGSVNCTVTGTPLVICTDSSATARTLQPGTVTEANSISFRITAGTGTLSLGTAPAYRDLDFTDGTNPTGYAGALGTTPATIYGNFKASTGMSATATANALTFAATSGTKTINTAGVTFDRPFIFNGVGGTFQLQAALTSGSARACTLTNGTLDLNGYTLTTGTFSSTNSNVRTLAFGSTGKIVLTATSGTIFTYGTATNLTVTGTSLVQATSGGAGTRTITFATTGGTETNAINFDITAGSDIVSLAGTGGAAKNVNFTGFSGTIDIPNAKTIYGNLDAGSATSITGTSTVTFAATSGTKTIRTNALTYGGSFTFNGIGGTWEMQDALTLTTTLTMTNGTLKLKSGTTNTVGAFATSGTNAKYLYATTSGTQATISDASGTNSVNYLTIQDSAATGGALFQAFTSNFNVDAGNNTGWKFSNNGGNFLVFF
jgi:fibronectin-binding autotransporter adhesin